LFASEGLSAQQSDPPSIISKERQKVKGWILTAEAVDTRKISMTGRIGRPCGLYVLMIVSACLVAAVELPAPAHAQGNEFFSCMDKDGRVTVTNRHYDERYYRCTPFAHLNRAFKEAEKSERNHPQSQQVRAGNEETFAAVQSARSSAESAMVAMEAARTAAESARLMAEANSAFAPPFEIIRR
jgi:hypothetical protein